METLDNLDNIIEIDKISKIFQKKERNYNALFDISLKINKGETFCIIGPNGSGKTTLLRILGLLEVPSTGKVYIFQKNTSNLKKKELVECRKRIAFVRQKPVVRNTSVFENIAYGLRIRGFKEKTIKNKVENLLEFIELKDYSEKNARTLSGGEIQRVTIAMNLIFKSEIVIFDEVFANLDPKNTDLVDKFIEKIKKDKSRTLIYSTHNKFEAIKYSDRIAVLINNKISQIGTPQEIFQNPKDEFTAQFVGYENIFSGIAHVDDSSELTQIKVGNTIINASCKRTGNVKVCIRPESIALTKENPQKISPRNIFKGEITKIYNFGNYSHIEVKHSNIYFLVAVTNQSLKNLQLEMGTMIFINFKATNVKIL